MSIATRLPTPNESARLTRRELPKLDNARLPAGLESFAPFKELVAKRRGLMKDALHARTASERADHAIHTAREQDAQAFEQAALDGKPDPGRTNELVAVKEQDEARRKAIALTRAHNRVVEQIREAIDGKPGEDAIGKVQAKVDASLKRFRDSVDVALAELGEVRAWTATLDSIEATRKADYVTLRNNAPKRIDVAAGGRMVDAAAALEGLRVWDPRGES